jgi:hypothetical protein
MFTSPRTVVLKGEDPAFPRRKFVSAVPTLTTDVVCASCNGGWMSDLEARASPLLSPLVGGQPQPLGIEEQAFIAIWAVKTTMAWQTTEISVRAIPFEDYRWLYAKRTPPPLARVRLGRYVGTGFPFIGHSGGHLYKSDTPTPVPDGTAPQGHWSILHIGQLVLEVFGSSDGRPRYAPLPQLTGDVLIEIWPSLKAAYWPPPKAVDDVGMVSFMRDDAQARPIDP